MDLLTVLTEIRSDRYGRGDGYGCSNGYGDTGTGIGWGNGCSNGYGDSCGCSNGQGGGWGCGRNYEFGWSNGCGYGDGLGSCRDYGISSGWEIVEINDMKVYAIDSMPTAIETVFGTYAKGYTISNCAVLTPCYVAVDGTSLAHGNTLKEAFYDARAKEMEKLPEDERVKRFITEHPNPDETLPNEKLFYIHHALTGSCEFGRREFCETNRIDLESSMSILEFLTLTENEYGGNVIKKIKEEYSCRG